MGVMIGGAIVAAATDITFNPRGYVAVLGNDVLTSLYLIMVKNTPATNGLRHAASPRSAWVASGSGAPALTRAHAACSPPTPPWRSTTGMLFYNSTLSLPMLFAAVVMVGEPTGIATFPLLFNRSFQVPTARRCRVVQARAPALLTRRLPATHARSWRSCWRPRWASRSTTQRLCARASTTR